MVTTNIELTKRVKLKVGRKGYLKNNYIDLRTGLPNTRIRRYKGQTLNVRNRARVGGYESLPSNRAWGTCNHHDLLRVNKECGITILSSGALAVV